MEKWNSRDVGYVCGSIYGGGHIIENKKYGNYAVLFETKNKQLADVFLERLNVFSKKKGKIHVKKRLSSKTSRRSFVATLYSKDDVKMLRLLGVVKNKNTLPKICYNNEEFLLFFIRGFFDSKATVRERVVSGKKRVSIRVFFVKERVLRELKGLLEKMGIRGIVYKSGKCYCLDIEGRAKIKRFMDAIGFDNIEKRKRIENVIGYSNVIGYEENM